jgi:hypothetical protein
MHRSRGILTSLFLVSAVGATIGATFLPDILHERKEVAGLAVVFGAEPEPALTEEMQFLRWRVSTLDTEVPYAEFEDATVTITFEGREFGPFDVRGSRQEPGQYQTQHIFTEAGEYSSVLRFRKAGAVETHEVDFDFDIGDRASLTIPGRRGGN